MTRSTGTIVSVKVPIHWEYMTRRQQTRLDRITSRDTRVIKAYLGVIERNKSVLVTDGRFNRIDAARLDRLTLTALRAKNPSKRRRNVPHDFKARFRNISFNELQECRDVAIGMWNSYLGKGGTPPLRSNNGRAKRIPRNIFTLRFNLIHRPDLQIKNWLELRDSLDSARQGRTRHDKLTIPLKMSPYHSAQLERGEIKSCRIVKDKYRKWWVIFAVRVDTSKPLIPSKDKPLAVMGVDLGISNAACAVVISSKGAHHVQYFHQPEKEFSLSRYARRVASLQREMRIRQSQGLPFDKVTKKLREMNQKRTPIREEWDRVLARKILNHAIELTSKYNLYVAVGNPKGIRNIASRQYGRGRKYRGMIHKWAFQRIITSIESGFSQLGWTTGRIGSRFLAVYEGRTSITCSMCGHRGIRPKQSLFICPTCGHRTNADRNGAINIARRMIRLTPALRDEHEGLGRWIYSSKKKPSPKAARRGKRSSERKSKLSQRSSASSDGESAVVRYVQTDLCSFGDEPVMSDEDPAVERAAKASSVTRHLDSPRTGVSGTKEQRTEATFRKRSHAPMKSDNARATQQCLDEAEVSDDCHESGGTQKLQAECEFHSPLRRANHTP
jgi:transposase